MPTYIYRCLSCNQIYELYHDAGAWVKECPLCFEQAATVLPPEASNYLKKQTNVESSPKERIDKYIREAKQDLRDYKYGNNK